MSLLALRMVERSTLVYKRTWVVLVSGLFEPIFYLASIGVGIGGLVGDVRGPGGQPVEYAAFVAPALMASAAMNGAMLEASFNFFYKLRFSKLYESVLTTPLTVEDVALGEILWALLRGGLGALAFLCVMLATGLVASPWAVLAVPAALLVGLAFAACGMAAISLCRTWQHTELVLLATLPLFLCSATFFPLGTYSDGFQPIVQATPLYQGVALLRALTLGGVGWASLGHVAYLTAMGAVGLVATRRRMATLLRT